MNTRLSFDQVKLQAQYIAKQDGVLNVYVRYHDDDAKADEGIAVVADQSSDWIAMAERCVAVARSAEKMGEVGDRLSRCHLDASSRVIILDTRHPGLTIVVMAEKGHPVMKSLKRMLARCFKVSGAAGNQGPRHRASSPGPLAPPASASPPKPEAPAQEPPAADPPVSEPDDSTFDSIADDVFSGPKN